ncbi:short-chain dehydrogenase [bacterium]|nr:short-chain dehydrogenase [bacterium]
MDLSGQRCMVLGGFGLVGMAVCRKLCETGAAEIVVTSLKQHEAESACETLRTEYPKVSFKAAWGDIFVRHEFKEFNRKELLADGKRRRAFIRDILDSFDEKVYERMTLYKMIVEHQPKVVVDCVNTATGIAYQDIYQQSEIVLDAMDRAENNDDHNSFKKSIEDLIASMSVPQLVRHIQILHQSLIDGNCVSYVKIGTTGTGGMGLNIPYTHSEDRPSRVLLTKNAMGGSQTLMLLLMGRTPLQQDDGSIREIYIKEIKPAAAIAWKEVRADEIRKKGQSIQRFDMNPDHAVELGGSILGKEENGSWKIGNDTLKSVFIDTGENGIFSEGEFTAITEVGQMEFVTPEEIAQYVIWEICGGNSGHDVIGALDSSVMSPTYRAGVLRQVALDKLHQIQNKEANAGLDESVAFELLGPPRLTKLLHECNLIRHAYKTMRAASLANPREMSANLANSLEDQEKLRSAILSVGVPILLPDGKHYLRGPKLLIPTDPVSNEFEVSPENLDQWCDKGWVDLRPGNMERWQAWFARLIDQKDARQKSGDTSSRYDFDENYFDPDKEINPGKMVGWIFINIDKGKRIKR